MSRCLLLPFRPPIQLMIFLGVCAVCQPLGARAGAPAGKTPAPPGPAPAAVAPDPPPPPLSPADEAARQQVRTLVREAGDLMERGDRAGAVAKLQQAQRLRPDPSLDYNLGVAYGEWGKLAESAAALERFLATGKPAAVTKDRVEDARRRLDGLRPRLARVTVQLAPGDAALAAGPATVLIDNRTLGPLPLAGHYLEPGAHDVRVTASGARDYIVNVGLVAGEERDVSAQLVPLAEGGGLAMVPRQGPPPDPPLYKKWWFWTAIGGGAALCAGLIGAGAAGSFNRRAPGSDLDALDVAR